MYGWYVVSEEARDYSSGVQSFPLLVTQWRVPTSPSALTRGAEIQLFPCVGASKSTRTRARTAREVSRNVNQQGGLGYVPTGSATKAPRSMVMSRSWWARGLSMNALMAMWNSSSSLTGRPNLSFVAHMRKGREGCVLLDSIRRACQQKYLPTYRTGRKIRGYPISDSKKLPFLRQRCERASDLSQTYHRSPSSSLVNGSESHIQLYR
jgi:hypothetical protein